jgi:hypothetical protein
MTEWFLNDGTGILIHLEDPEILLVGNQLPDWVRAPIECPEIGGRELKVVGALTEPCPKCRRTVRHIILDVDYGVAQCLEYCGFVWYAKAKTNACIE